MASALDIDALATALARVLGAGVAVEAPRRVTGGASRETWLFDAVDGAGARHALVLRRDPTPVTGPNDRAVEFRLLAAAHAAGVAVPEVVLLLEAGDDLGSGFVMQ